MLLTAEKSDVIVKRVCKQAALDICQGFVTR